MASYLDILLADIPFRLLADRGMFWPEQRTLFIADTHFGKGAAFRKAGIPVPAGSTEGTLAKIAGMIRNTNSTRLCILGDMFHARSSLAKDVCQSIDEFMNEFSQVKMLLVRGNHDSRLCKLPANWPIEIVEPGFMIERVALAHQPAEVPRAAKLLLCGHIHPAIRLPSRTDSFGKIPCFWHSRGCMVVPAIGEFTGTHLIQLAPDDNAWLTVSGEIYSL